MLLDEIKFTIKQRIIIEGLELNGITADDIKDEEPLFGEGLGLESVDVLYIVKGIEKEFGFKVDLKKINSLKKHFTSVNTLSEYVRDQISQSTAENNMEEIV